MGESQGAGDCFMRKKGEETNEDEAGEQDEGGDKHGGFEQRPAELRESCNNGRSEKGEHKRDKGYPCI